jgi:class 3 adenylate cyclase/tetratricopeptide (TPR) repeat protein
VENLVPRFILEKYAEGETEGRFAAVSLFADISGFSAVTNALMRHGSEAAEAMADMMLAIFDPLVQQIHAHGGLITTFAGDAFTALFPSAGAAESYARALAAAVGIQRHMIANPTQTTPYGNFPFTIKLGLGDGEVEWGILRPQDAGAPPEEAEVKAAYYFSGSAIEAAAAAEHHAQSGNLILNATVYERVQSLVKVIPVSHDPGGHVRLLRAEGLPAPLPAEPSGEHTAVHEQAFIPDAILQRATGGDFRQVVSVFVKLMGIETSEDLAIFMQSVFALQQQVGGYLNRVDFGDKGCTMLLYWGMPTSFENDIERALSFVLELGNYTPGTFRAGITYHPMYAGLAGSPDRGEFTCYGDGINLAARLMIAAPWGSIWLDGRMAERASRMFALDFVDHLPFKGFADKQAVYALVERKQEAGGGAFRGQMIGRSAEMAQLNAFVQPLFAPPEEQRFAGILVVQGEPGSGKSRLTSEFLTGEAGGIAATCHTLVCQTDPVIRKPLNPFRYWLHAYFDQSITRSEARNKRAFSRKLDQLIAAVPDPELAKELNRVRSFLGALVNLVWDSSLYAQLDPQGRFENTLGGLKTLLKAESLIRPVILLLEDAQWLDADSMEFCRRLIRNVEPYPLAVLATARPERKGVLFGEGLAYQQIDLESLAPDDMRLLAVDRLGAPIDDELTGLLIERAEGNPFFGEQILLYLREQGAIARRNGQWHLVADAVTSSLPADVRTLFVARLDELDHPVTETVQTAAVLGREFEVPILARMVDHATGITEHVAVAEHELIWLSLGSLRYRFTQSLLRDAAYEMQLRARRRELHQLAAAALEAHYAGDPAPPYDRIAHHFEAAYLQGATELRSQALDYLQKAAEEAGEAYENAAAVDFYSRALALAPETEAGCRFQLLLAREGIYHLQGARQLQAQDLTALAELAAALKEPSKQAAVALREAKYTFATGDYAKAIAAAQMAAAFAQAAQDPATEVAGYIWWGSALERSGDEEAALAQYGMALDLSRAAEDRRGEADALRGLGIIAWQRSKRAEGQEHFRQSLAITQELGDRRGEAATLNNLGLILNELDEFGEAQAAYGRALAIRRDIGDRAGEGSTLNNLGLLLQTLGAYAEARVKLQASLEIWREIGSRPGEVVTMDNLGFVTRMLGDCEASQAYLSGALELERTLGARKAEGWTLNNLGSLHLALGDTARAEAYFLEALALRRGAGLKHYVAEDLAGLARVALAQGKLAEAVARIDELWPILEDKPALDGAEHPLVALVTCYRVLHAAGDPRAAPLLGTLHARLQERAAKITDDGLRRSFLESVPEHRELLQVVAGTMAEAPPLQPAPSPGPTPIADPLPPSPVVPPAAETVTPAATSVDPPPPAPEVAPATKPLIARIPLEGLEGASPIVVVIESLTINVQNGPGIALGPDAESSLADLLRQLLGKAG